MADGKGQGDDRLEIDRDDLDDVLMEAARLQMADQEDGKVVLNDDTIARIAASTGITKELLLKAHGSVREKERRQRRVIALAAAVVMFGALLSTPVWWPAVFPPDPVARAIEAESYQKRALQAREDGSSKQAIRHARKAVALVPDNHRAWHTLALSYQDNGRYAEARQAYLTAIEKATGKPDTAVIYYDMGAFVGSSPEHREEALGYYRQALTIDPDYAPALNELGWAHEQMGQPQEAIAAYKKAVKADPEHEEATSNLRRLEIKLGLRDLAAEKLDAVKASVLNKRGDTSYSAKKYEEAITYYKQGLALNPKDYAAWNDLGLAYEKNAQAKEAVSAFKEAMRIGAHARDNCYSYFNMARLMDDAGEYDESLRLNLEALKCRPDYPGALNNIARVYEKLERFDEAIVYYKKAIQVDPSYALAKRNLKNLERRLAAS